MASAASATVIFKKIGAPLVDEWRFAIDVTPVRAEEVRASDEVSPPDAPLARFPVEPLDAPPSLRERLEVMSREGRRTMVESMAKFCCAK